MKIVCTLEVLNRRAFAHGQNGRMKPIRVVVLLKTDTNGKGIIIISTNKEIRGQQYYLENIGTIRKNFLHEGKITIEMRDPDVTLMFRGAREDDLKKLLENIQSFNVKPKESNCDVQTGARILDKPSGQSISVKCESNSRSSSQIKRKSQLLLETGPNPSTSIVNPSPQKELKNVSKKNTLENFLIKGHRPSDSVTPGSSSSRKRSKDVKESELQHLVLEDKKARLLTASNQKLTVYPETGLKVNLGTSEMSAIRKALKTKTKLIVKKREDYPFKGFSLQLQNLIMNELCLQKVDSRLLDLKNLQVLDLSNNRITTIEVLKGLNSRLRKLVLDKNCIERISEDFFCSEAMKGLMTLSIKENKLVTLPRSILKLEYLLFLWLSKNNLQCLPYNIHFMKSLVNLLLNDNKLSYLPFTISMAGLVRLDVSNNNFPIKETRTKLVRIQLEEFPTLFEIAAGFIQSNNYKKRNNKDKILKVTPTDVPSLVYDFLEGCKYCVLCGSMTARYTVQTLFLNSYLAEELIGQPGLKQIQTKKVICDNCSPTVISLP